MMKPIVSFGQWVRQRRATLHLTQGELAQRVYCSEIMIRKIEADERRPSADIARNLTVHLQIPADLVGRFLKVARGELNVDHLPLLQSDPQPPRHWLPVLSRADLAIPQTSFLGRTQEIAQVCDLLQQPATRLLTLVGPPGIGKSRLALHVAAALENAFLHGVHFVPLAPLRNPDLVADAVAQIFGFADSAYPTPLDHLRAELRQRHLLLLLDNFEHLLPAGRFVQELLTVAPQLKLLVTSRVPLVLTEEQLYPVPALPTPALNGASPSQAPSALTAIRYPAVQLLVTRARDNNADFTLTGENAGAVAAICARVDGLPLAIELVAARLKTLPPATLLERLSNWLDLTIDERPDLPERHRTLRHAIAWSYDLLPPAAQMVFARLGVFVHGATLAHIQRICTVMNNLTTDVGEQLTLLVNHNLVRAEESTSGGTRYTMLETVLDYARERLTVAGQIKVFRQLHAQLFCDFIEAAAPKLHGLERRTWLTRIEQENDNLRAALRWAAEQGEIATLARLVAALGWFWEMQGRRSEARQWLTMMEALPTAQQPPLALARIQHMLGHIANEEGDLERSRHWANSSLALAEAIGDRWTVALARRDLDWVYFAADNNVEGAIALADKAAAELLALNDLRNYLLTLLDAAMICQISGDAARGLPYAQSARRLAQEWEDEPSAGEALSALGLLTYTAGDRTTGIALLEECLAVSAKSPNGKQIAWSHYKLAQVLLDFGDLPRAAEHFVASGRLWSDRNEVVAVAYCQSGEANCRFGQGDLRRAQELYASTLTIYRRFQIPRAAAWTLYNLAQAAARLSNDAAQVQTLLDESLALFTQIPNEQRAIACINAARNGEWTLPYEPIRP